MAAGVLARRVWRRASPPALSWQYPLRFHVRTRRGRYPVANDPTLATLAGAPDDHARREAIDAILERIRPTVTAIVCRFRRAEPAFGQDDAEELIGSVMLRVLRKLQTTGLDEGAPIESLESYVATITYNALHDFRRRRTPERTRLKDKLRYVITHDRRFAVRTEGDETVCVLVRPVAISEAAMRDRDRPADAVAAILGHAGEPMTLAKLVDAVMEAWNIHEAPALSDPIPQAPPADQLAVLESKEALQELWREIVALPPNQRAALLLNLRDGHGGNALTLILLLNVAGIEEVAEAVGMSTATLSEVWEDLPLDDLTIAGLLRLQRQQVINLRNSARARLARRLRGTRH